MATVAGIHAVPPPHPARGPRAAPGTAAQPPNSSMMSRYLVERPVLVGWPRLGRTQVALGEEPAQGRAVAEKQHPVLLAEVDHARPPAAGPRTEYCTWCETTRTPAARIWARWGRSKLVRPRWRILPARRSSSSQRGRVDPARARRSPTSGTGRGRAARRRGAASDRSIVRSTSALRSDASALQVGHVLGVDLDLGPPARGRGR